VRGKRRLARLCKLIVRSITFVCSLGLGVCLWWGWVGFCGVGWACSGWKAHPKRVLLERENNFSLRKKSGRVPSTSKKDAEEESKRFNPCLDRAVARGGGQTRIPESTRSWLSTKARQTSIRKHWKVKRIRSKTWLVSVQ